MAVFNHVPTWGSQLSVDPRTYEAKFGDGYEQSTPNGLNNVLEVWSIQFTDIKDDEYYQIKSFLKDHKGTIAFQWTTPDGDTLWFKCRSWTSNPPSFGVRSMSLKFEQVMI